MQLQIDQPRKDRRIRIAAWMLAIAILAIFTGVQIAAPQSTQATQATQSTRGVNGVLAAQAVDDVGYIDFAFEPAQSPTPSSGYQDTGPTASKPQSKLWYNDGYWWGSLLNGSTHTYNIYRLDWQTQAWADTGTLIDNRSTSHADCLWDGTFLYVATAVPPGDPGNTAIHVLRYTYDTATKTYTQDMDWIPATGGVEAVVLDRDSIGDVWVSYTLDTGPSTRAVYVTHNTRGGGFLPPYVIPVTGADNLTNDDISAIVAFNGKVGVMWSNQTDDAIYFAIHIDGSADTEWQGGAAYTGPHFGDDHLNIKSLNADPSGQVFAVIKTSLNDLPDPNPDDPQIVVLVLPQSGNWYARVFSRVQDRHTRPLLLIDSTNRQLYVFAASNSGEVPSAIYYKQSNLDNVTFTAGPGSPFIASNTHLNINNPTSTKQNLTAESGLLVEASDLSTGYYLHNAINLGGGGGTPSPVPSSTSTPNPSGTPTACPIEYTDVPPGSTFYHYVRCLACKGIISGYEDGTFRPGNDVTRGQLSKIVSNAAGFTDPVTTQSFEDVLPGSTFYDYIGRLASRGVMGGYPCGGPGEPCGADELPYFRPGNNATRGQLSKIVCRAYGCINTPSTQTFEDVPPTHTFYTEIEQLVALGAIGGYPCGNPEPCVPPENRPYFRPGNNVTRGQSAKIVSATFFPNCQVARRASQP